VFAVANNCADPPSSFRVLPLSKKSPGLIWDVVSQIKVGEHGQAYVIDADGHLIAHPDISLVLRTTVEAPSCWGVSCWVPGNTDMTKLAQVRAARTAGAGAGGEAKDILGRDVLSAYAPVAQLGWLVFVEMPIEEAK
jgi:two-component system, NtrC family, sensor kinase